DTVAGAGEHVQEVGIFHTSASAGADGGIPRANPRRRPPAPQRQLTTAILRTTAKVRTARNRPGPQAHLSRRPTTGHPRAPDRALRPVPARRAWTGCVDG